jgi:hypothetical protein
MTALAVAGVLLAGACGGGSNDDKAAARNDAKSAESSKASKAATGSGAEAAEFCSQAKTLYNRLTSSSNTDPTSAEAKAVFAQAKALRAPDAIAADWSAILDKLVAPVVSGELDVKDPKAASELAARASELGGALQRTGAYFENECDFG